MRERVVRFGAGNGLVGILAEPTPVEKRPERPAVLFLNSGILHRIGSCRMHVRLSRALASAGYASLRFDFSGIGDSDTRRDSLAFEQSAPLEIREALDRVSELQGARQFILAGLCSGADAAVLRAPDEPRVAGLVLLDPWAYPTRRTRAAYKIHRLGERDAWSNQLKRYLPHIFGPLPTQPDAPEALQPEFEIPTYVRGLPPRDDVAAMYQAVLSRGGRILLAYMGVSLSYSYRHQFWDAFPELHPRKQVRLLHLPESDHIVSRLSDQERLDAEVLRWIQEQWPIEAAGRKESPRLATPSGT